MQGKGANPIAAQDMDLAPIPARVRRTRPESGRES